MRKFGAKLLEVLRKGDMVLLALCVLTSVFGIVMVAASTAYDGSSRYVIIQTGALITGILLYLALTAFDIDILAGQRTLLFLFNTAFLPTTHRITIVNVGALESGYPCFQ